MLDHVQGTLHLISSILHLTDEETEAHSNRVPVL